MQKSSIFKARMFEITIIGAVKTTYSGPPADNVMEWDRPHLQMRSGKRDEQVLGEYVDG